MTNRTPRLLFALLLLSSMWMPAHSCAGYRAANGEFVTMIPAGADSARYAPARNQFVPIQRADLTTVDGWVGLWPYLWVLPVLAFAWSRPRSLIPDGVTLAVAPLVVWLLNFQLFERTEYGTYVASIALGALWLLALYGAIKWWWTRRSGARSA